MIAIDKLISHRASLYGFGRVARALRTMAAARLHQAHQAQIVADLQVQTLFQIIARLGGIDAPCPSLPPFVIVVGPEHGFTGNMSARLLDEAAGMQPGDFLLVGAALVREARIRRFEAGTLSLAAHIKAARITADQVNAEISTRADSRPVGILAADPMTLQLTYQRLFPVQIKPLDHKIAPLIHLPARDLIPALTMRYRRAIVDRAIIGAIAAENRARRQRLDNALDGVDERLDQLDRELARARQDAITVELGDLIGGIISAA